MSQGRRQKKERKKENPLVNEKKDKKKNEKKKSRQPRLKVVRIGDRVVGPWLVSLQEQGQTLALLLSILESGRSAGVGNCKDGGRSQGSGELTRMRTCCDGVGVGGVDARV